MATHREPTVVLPGEGRRIWWLGGTEEFVCLSAATGGAFSLSAGVCKPGGGPIRHVHSREEEAFYVLGGELTFKAAGKDFRATAGAYVGLPKGVPHQFENGRAEARLLMLLAPGAGEGFFLDLGTPIAAAKESPPPPDPADMTQVGAEYGLTMLPPSDPAGANPPAGAGRTPFTLPPGGGEPLVAPGAVYTLKATGEQTDGAYTAAEVAVTPGRGTAAVRHPRYLVGLYVLEGDAAVLSGGQTFRAPPGGFVHIPRGADYSLVNQGTGTLRVLAVSAPAGLERYLRAAYPSAGGPPADPARPAATAEQHGVEVLPAAA